MNKVFLFDMDGVLVDSEPSWELIEREYLPGLFGKEIVEKMPNLVGAGLEKVLELATSLGATFDRTHAIEVYEEIAQKVYERSPITNGVEDLVDRLHALGYRLGVVTQSPQTWINHVLPRLSFKEKFESIISLHQHPELKRKPAPDGFLYAIRTLEAAPSASLILEDSNYGIQAGKAAGCYVIGYRGNLLDGYVQEGADAYADTMAEVQKIVENTIQP
jgi:HAD superfamily hydrolase (TIGR01509 family)